jgi:hypothetical protein
MAGDASARDERARELGRQARDRINADFNVDNPETPPRASQKLIAAATLLRAMPAPSTPEARNLHCEAQALIEQAAVQQAESSVSRIRQQGSAQNDGGVQGTEPSVHAGGAAEPPANLGRTPAKERLLDTRGQARDGDAHNVINTRRTSKAEARVAAGYHPRRGGRYDSDEDCSPTPEPPGTRVFSREKMVNEDLSSTAKHAGTFEAAEHTKEVPLDPVAPQGKALRVSSTLDPK